MNAVTRAVCDALLKAPVTIREVARRSGISHAQLARITKGQRNATPAVARVVAAALEAIAADATQSAQRVRRSLATLERGGKQ